MRGHCHSCFLRHHWPHLLLGHSVGHPEALEAPFQPCPTETRHHSQNPQHPFLQNADFCPRSDLIKREIINK